MTLGAGAVQELEEDVDGSGGGPHSFPGQFGGPGAVWVLSAHSPSPFFPIPLPAVARWFGSLGLTRVWEAETTQPGSLWPHCPRAP